MIAAPPDTVTRRNGRAVLVIAGTALLLLAAILAASSVGAVRLTIPQVFDGLLDRGDAFARTIVWQIRFPRVLVAAMVGMNLAIAGCILQSITRNPLGDPHVLGFSSGAGLVSIALLTLASGYPVQLVPFAAFLGSLLSASVVFALAWRGGISPVRFALAGVAVAALFTAISTALIATSDLFTQATLSFLAGGLYQRNWTDVWTIMPYTVGAGCVAILVAGALNMLLLGDDVARSLGMHVERTRLLLAGLAAVLTGSAVAVSGLLAFVGLVAPHVARLLVGSDQRFVVPLSALIGALLLVMADAVARVVIAPSEIPVGILTAVIGAPVLLILIRTRT